MCYQLNLKLKTQNNKFYPTISFEACNLLVAVDQTVYEGGEGFPENLKTDDDLLRQRVTFILAKCFTDLDMLKVETYVDGLNDIFTSTILESPPHHQIYFRCIFLENIHNSDENKTNSPVREICDDLLMIFRFDTFI